MSRRVVVAALLLIALTAAAEKRRAIGPSDARCVHGVLTDGAFVQNVALDATHIYWLDSFNSELFRVPKNGGARTLIADFPIDFVMDIAVDDTNVYVATILPPILGGDLLPGTIYAVPKAGGTVRVLALGVPYPVRIAADSTHVYWVSVGTVKLSSDEVLSDGKIERARKDGTGRETLASALSAPLTFALDDTHVYFNESGQAVGNASTGMRRVPKGGGNVEQLTNNQVAVDMQIVDGQIVYYGGRVFFGEVGIHRLPKSGGEAVALVRDEEMFAGPRVIDGQVYYLTYIDEEFTDALMRVPLAGGQPQYLYSPDSDGEDFEVDACGVVYGNYFGELRRGGK